MPETCGISDDVAARLRHEIHKDLETQFARAFRKWCKRRDIDYEFTRYAGKSYPQKPESTQTDAPMA